MRRDEDREGECYTGQPEVTPSENMIGTLLGLERVIVGWQGRHCRARHLPDDAVSCLPWLHRRWWTVGPECSLPFRDCFWTLSCRVSSGQWRTVANSGGQWQAVGDSGRQPSLSPLIGSLWAGPAGLRPAVPVPRPGREADRWPRPMTACLTNPLLRDPLRIRGAYFEGRHCNGRDARAAISTCIRPWTKRTGEEAILGSGAISILFCVVPG